MQKERKPKATAKESSCGQQTTGEGKGERDEEGSVELKTIPFYRIGEVV